MADIESYLDGKRVLINRALLRLLPLRGPGNIVAAMRYSIEAGGKRLRPILTIITAEALGMKDEEVLDVACAIEYIHTYSLIHDDLPAMDDSALRRGVPTCHCVYGDAIAVLAGDAFLTRAFELIALYGRQEQYRDRALHVALELTSAAGTDGMIGGQVLDLLAEGKDLKFEEIKNIAAMKTGALLKASVACGAITAGAGKGESEALIKYADLIGMAFQIVDDILDKKGTTEELGKPAGADQLRAKATIPALLGVQDAQTMVDQLYHEAINVLEGQPFPTDLLAALAYKLIYRNK